MNQSLQKQPEKISTEVDLINTVRACVFNGSTDNELKLFMFKCQEVGVHPLSQMIIPVAFTDNFGNRKVSFISTIDFFRSQSEDAGDYDGMDEIEFVGESSLEFTHKVNNKDITDVIVHPDEAICRVYRKEISRPFVGKARWDEFYPGDKKGHMWRKMPHIMLGKCAEAQARRLAWPKKLNKLYTEEEMDRGFAALASGSVSNKPSVTPDDIHVSNEPATTDYSEDVKSLRKPTDEERQKGKLVSEKQGYLMYKTCKDSGVDIGSVAAAAKVENIFFLTWRNTCKTNFNVMLNAVKTEPNRFAKYSKSAQVSKDAQRQSEAPTVMDQDEFSSLVSMLATQAGMSVEDGLKEGFGIDDLEDVLPELQSKVIDFFNARAEGTAA